VDSVHHVKFSQVETHLLGAAASDNSIILYDTRNVGPVRKVVMNLRSNALAWNPMEVSFYFILFIADPTIAPSRIRGVKKHRIRICNTENALTKKYILPGNGVHSS
jgi:WD repeat and SOF domain-containing protein 1